MSVESNKPTAGLCGVLWARATTDAVACWRRASPAPLWDDPTASLRPFCLHTPGAGALTASRSSWLPGGEPTVPQFPQSHAVSPGETALWSFNTGAVTHEMKTKQNPAWLWAARME